MSSANSLIHLIFSAACYPSPFEAGSRGFILFHSSFFHYASFETEGIAKSLDNFPIFLAEGLSTFPL